jgi:hypothetical protein
MLTIITQKRQKCTKKWLPRQVFEVEISVLAGGAPHATAHERRQRIPTKHVPQGSFPRYAAPKVPPLIEVL